MNGTMGRIGRLALALVAGGALLLGTVAGAGAGNITTTNGVVGGARTLSTADSANLSTTLSGEDLVVSGDLGASTVVDATGSGAGWNLTVSMSPFTTAAGKTLPSGAALTITGVSVVKNAGKAPVNTVVYPVTVGASAVKFYSAAADSGMGKFTVTPAVSLSVPADTYAGTYATTITMSVVAGP